MAYGQNSVVGLAFQNSFGTVASVSSLAYVQHVGESVGLEIPELMGEIKRGVFDEPDSFAGPYTVGGELNIEPLPAELGMCLKGMFGDPSTVTSGSLYTHTFEPGTSDWDSKAAKPPMTYYKFLDATGSGMLYYDLNISEMSFDIAAGELMKAKATFVGGRDSMVVEQTGSYYSQGGQWTWDQASLQIGGSANGDIEKLTITVTDNVAAKHSLNASKYPQRIKREGARQVSVSGTIRFENTDEYLQFTAQSHREFDVTFKGSTEVQSGYPETVRFQMPRVKYTDFKPQVDGEGELMVSFSGKAKYSTTSGTAILVTLQNGIAAYF